MVPLTYLLESSLPVTMAFCNETKGQLGSLGPYLTFDVAGPLGTAIREVKGKFLHFSVSLQFAQKVVHLPRVKVPSRYLHAFKSCLLVLEVMIFNG